MIAISIALLFSQTSVGPMQDVFTSGTLDPTQQYEVFRIPALTRTRRGTLLAFAEARKSIDDQSSNILVLRRLLPKSKNWTPLTIVMRDEPASLNNPCVLVTKSVIWLMYQRYPQGLNERTTQPNFDPEASCRTFIISSVDEGLTWTKPRELTSTVKGAGIQSDACGPGIGVEVQRGKFKGRLVFPFNEGAKGKYDVFAVYSDDRGQTWKRGNNAPKPDGIQPNEVQVAGMSDGGLRLNARNQAKGHFRLSSVSHDGGANWDMVKPEPSLPDPVCMGSILRLSYNPNVLVMSNPSDPTRRARGLVRTSTDDGNTWSKGIAIPSDSFEYSCLCPLPGNRVGILFESKENSTTGQEGYRIRFTTIAIMP